MKRQLLNTVDQDTLSYCIDDYFSRRQYETTSMSKAAPGSSLSTLVDIVHRCISPDLEYKSGNFYKHSHPYLPHTDYRAAQDNTINVVFPLSYTGQQASLVVFDQLWYADSVTWCLSGPVHEFSINTGVPGNPCDYGVVGLTDHPVDELFYKKYLTNHPAECFFGMSGHAFPFEPGSMIIFDNRMVHCTSAFTGVKLGISLRFRDNGAVII